MSGITAARSLIKPVSSATPRAEEETSSTRRLEGRRSRNFSAIDRPVIIGGGTALCLSCGPDIFSPGFKQEESLAPGRLGQRANAAGRGDHRRIPNRVALFACRSRPGETVPIFRRGPMTGQTCREKKGPPRSRVSDDSRARRGFAREARLREPG